MNRNMLDGRYRVVGIGRAERAAMSAGLRAVTTMFSRAHPRLL